MSKALTARNGDVQTCEDLVLEYLRPRRGFAIVTGTVSAKLGMSCDAFRGAINNLLMYGTIERVGGSTIGGWSYKVNEAVQPRAARISCPRCGTVDCERHTATRLTNGYVGQVMGGW